MEHFCGSIAEAEVKKWRYAEPTQTFGALHFESATLPGIFIAGDGFGGGSVEGAWRSGCSVAEAVN